MTNEELCALAQHGDRDALNRLVEVNLPFVRARAYELAQSYGFLGVEVDDLIQVGCMGLLRAVPTFTPGRKVTFLSYAGSAIRNAMLDLVREYQNRIENCFYYDESFPFRFCPLGEQGEEDDVFTVPADEIEDKATLSPEQICLKRETVEEVRTALRSTPPREQTYLRYRFGFENGQEHFLKTAAVHFHLSESRARKTEQRGLEMVREALPW
ncbi:MAG: sigma-70 family RNA polymerase sigma factor [Clostridiales bacterium]|nr:sigma-70 family RNA polymerase sigma factor [Clostridiales bacterium]